MTAVSDSFLQGTVDAMLRNKHVHGAVLCVESGDGGVQWRGAAGDMAVDAQFFIASVTKLYITAVMLLLRAEGKLGFDDKVYTYFPEEMMNRIHVLNGVDYTKDITIKHLLSNASGLPDYFSGGAADSLMAGNDKTWFLAEVLDSIKQLPPKFAPGQKGKVNYSDTNYQLLGGIIEKVTGMTMAEVFDVYIFQPLQLKHTYAYTDIADTRPVQMYHNGKRIWVPRYMASVTAEGGIVSTAGDVMLFLKAFFTGKLFPVELIDELKTDWRMIFFPGQFSFGVGLEKLWTPRFMSPFHPVGEVLGFWGQSGAFAFYNPSHDLYFTGTVNQLNGWGHPAAHKAMTKVIKSV